MPIRISKSKIYRKIQVVNNIQHIQPRPSQGRNAVLRHALAGCNYLTCMVGMQFCDTPGSERNLTTYPGRNAVIRLAPVGMQLFDMPWWRFSFTTCLVRTPFHGMPWSGHSFTTCPGQDAVLQYIWVGTQFNGIPESERSFIFALVGM